MRIDMAINSLHVYTHFFSAPSLHRLDHGLDEGDLFGCEVVFGVEFGIGPGLCEVLDGNETIHSTHCILRYFNR